MRIVDMATCSEVITGPEISRYQSLIAALLLLHCYNRRTQMVKACDPKPIQESAKLCIEIQPQMTPKKNIKITETK